MWMIECRDILALCDRLAGYVLSLDLHVLRRRYNGKALVSSYALAVVAAASMTNW
jgi:hypothetical protein